SSSRTNAATTPSPTTTATYSRSSQSRRLAMAAPPINARTTTAPPRAGSPSSVGQPSANRKAMPATVSTSRYRSPKAVIPIPAAAVAVTTARNVPLIMLGPPHLLDRVVLPMWSAAVGAPCPGQGTGPRGSTGNLPRVRRGFGAGGTPVRRWRGVGGAPVRRQLGVRGAPVRRQRGVGGCYLRRWFERCGPALLDLSPTPGRTSPGLQHLPLRAAFAPTGAGRPGVFIRGSVSILCSGVSCPHGPKRGPECSSLS